MKTRLMGLLCVAALLRSAGVATAQDSASLTDARLIQRVQTAIGRGLEYLAGKQHPDGVWFSNDAVNALALLAYMGQGHAPGRGPYRDVLERGKRVLLSDQRADGFISGEEKGRAPSMYVHALSTLALAEMYGMDYDPQVEPTLRKAVDLIVRAQSPSGGWRYNPQPGDQDLSVTVMQIVALRAANNAEIPVPTATIGKAMAYVRSCAVKSGGFGYQAGGGVTPQMAGAGALSLQLLGQYNDPTVAPAMEYLSQIPATWGGGPVSQFFYFHYYSMQAHYQAGGKYWADWHPRVRELLLSKQNEDGSWDAPPGSGNEANPALVGPNKIYSTAMACLVLEIYDHFLPAYQR